MNDKKKKTKTADEKSVTHDKSAKRYVLVLMTILVAGLVVSMFKSTTAPKTPPKVTDNYIQPIPPTNFAQQVKFEKSQLNAAKMREQTTPGYNDINDDGDSQWEQKERLRVLNSRKCGFGMNHQQRNEINSQDNESNNMELPVMYQSDTAQSQPSYPPNSTQSPYYSSGSNSGHKPGESIRGRQVDDSYAGQQKGNRLLIPTGTIMDGVLDQDLVSDYTGPWEGHLTQDVYSIDNQFILLPKGTKIMGQSLHITNVNEPIQNRMGLTVEWAVLPNGKRINFRMNTPIDQAGVPAFAGSVNRHLVAQFLSIAAYATISAAGPQDPVNQNGYTQPTFSGQFAEGYREAALPFLMKYLSLVPTVTLQAGMPIKIHTQDDLYVKPWARVNTTVY